MKEIRMLFVVSLIAGVSFFLGTLVPGSVAQTQDKKRDSQGRYLPTVPSSLPERKSYFGVEGYMAFVVGAVEPNSPAEKLGLERGDFVVEIDGKPFFSLTDVLELVGEKKPGNAITMKHVNFNTSDCKVGVKVGQATMGPLRP